MPRAGYAARKRQRLGLPPAKPGRVPWVRGSKVKFFESAKDDYLAAAEIKGTGAFYEKMAQRYLKKYGYKLRLEDDLEEGVDVASDVDSDEDTDALPAAESKSRSVLFKKLKGKIGSWYNTRYGGSVEGKKKKTTSFKKVFDKPELDPPAPVKPRLINHYTHRFYNQRIKAHVEARWAVESRRPDPPKLIVFRNKVIRECWEAESEAFKAEVTESLEKEHKAAMEAYAVASAAEAPTTPEEYNIALNNAGYYLQPFADAIAERFGMNVAVLLCGPVADRGGNIEMRSVHSGMSGGLVPRIWSDYDRAGFDACQRSFVNFSHECFSEEQCRARSLTEKTPTAPSSGAMGDGIPADASSSSSAPPNATVVPAASASAPPNATAVTPPATSTPPTGPAVTPPSTSTPPTAVTPPSISTAPTGTEATPESGSAPPLTSFNDPSFGDGDEGRMLRGDEYDFSQMMPPDLWFSAEDVDKRVGRALRAELKKLDVLDYAREVGDLSKMSDEEVDRANDRARDQLFFDRLARNIPATKAMELSSDPEDNGDERPTVPTGTTGAAAGRMRATRSDTVLSGGGDGSDGPRSTDGRDEVNNDEERGGEGDVSGKESWWDVQTKDSWPEELVNAFGGFSRGRVWGGESWQTCISLLLEMQKINGYQEKGALNVPTKKDERPVEVGDFMQRHRVWGSSFPIKGVTGPRDVDKSFASRWWTWWEVGQPQSRVGEDGWASPANVDSDDWSEMRLRYGRNGMLLYIGGLLWWGEAAASKEGAEKEILLADWRLAVEDVKEVLSEVVKPVGESRAPSGDGETPRVQVSKIRSSTKRKAGGKDKENVVPKRRRVKQ
ncbi:hypothetical protein R3P38DRAFT_2763051 [Favolaschia claudopus]|uniref:Uncharacterized protein n=1 Tax=Favolaschia claudopus TaxID=2862362 RepID=A0AAW0DNG2_9AGAR